MKEEEKLLLKFHDDLGDLVFESTKKIPVQKIILELEIIKVLLEFNYFSQIAGNVQHTFKREDFNKGYG